MLDFFLILFFSKTVLLTPDFIDIEKDVDNYVIVLDESINAITAGASIQLDVSEMVFKGGKTDLLNSRRVAKEMFPKGAVKVKLLAKEKSVLLDYQGAVFINDAVAKLVLSSDDMPTDVDFDSIAIDSKVKLERVKVYWKNYKK